MKHIIDINHDMNECVYVYVCVLVLGLEHRAMNIWEKHYPPEIPAKN